MKTRINKFFIFFLLPLILAASGCKKDYKTITEIHPDGSCERMFIITSGSQNTDYSALPLPYDSTWQVNWKKDTAGDGDYILTAKKDFNNYEDLNRLYNKINNSAKIKVHVKIEKKFRWFYTYFYYHEEYSVFNLFNKVPISKYLTQQEIQDYISGKKNDAIDDKINKWEERNILEDFYGSLLQAVKKLNDPSLTPEIVASKKEELFKMLDSIKGSNDALLLGLENFYKTNAVYKIKSDIENSFKDIEKKAERMFEAVGSYSNIVTMPGLLLNTNAEKIEGNKVSWEFSSKMFEVTNIEMKAESRVMNTWALLVSAVLVLLILASFFIPSMSRRKIKY